MKFFVPTCLGNVNFSSLCMKMIVKGDDLPPQTSMRVVSISGGKVVVGQM